MEDSIADQIVNGECCALCTMPFIEDHGYPVACEECWDKKCGYQKAIHPIVTATSVYEITNEPTRRWNSNMPSNQNLPRIEATAQQKLNGIIKFINKGLNITRKGDGTWGLVLADYMNQYFPENGVPPQEPELAAIEVQKDFGAFVKWFKENRKNYEKINKRN